MRASEQRAGVEGFVQRRCRCPTCRKSWSSKTTATRHIEEGCHRDLAVRACSTCRHDFRADGHNDNGCDLDARPEGEHIVRNCDRWEAKRWLLTA